MTQADRTESILLWARDLYANSVDRKNAAGFAAAFTTDASLRFGNALPLTGPSAIESAIAQFFTTFAALRHEPKGAWLAGDTLVLEALVTYTRHDRQQVTIPAVTIFRLTNKAAEGEEKPMADDCRIYVDLTPLYAVGERK